MSTRLYAAMGIFALALGMSAPVRAQQKPTIAIMPTQYFSADKQSADNITRGLTSDFSGKGYTVMDIDRSISKYQAMGLGDSSHYADKVALKFGRSMGSDLVAYPRLLALGLPINGVKTTDFLAPEAIVHLRVLNVHTGQPIYFRQVGYAFTATGDIAGFQLPQSEASAAATATTNNYFERVAGSRQEFRRR